MLDLPDSSELQITLDSVHQSSVGSTDGRLKAVAQRLSLT